MLTGSNVQANELEAKSFAEVANKTGDQKCATPTSHSRLAKALRVEWLGQTVASLCWIASVFTYGISSAGDWLQLLAASAWLLANIAVLVTPESD